MQTCVGCGESFEPKAHAHGTQAFCNERCVYRVSFTLAQRHVDALDRHRDQHQLADRSSALRHLIETRVDSSDEEIIEVLLPDMEQRAEIEHLREALERIAGANPNIHASWLIKDAVDALGHHKANST